MQTEKNEREAGLMQEGLPSKFTPNTTSGRWHLPLEAASPAISFQSMQGDMCHDILKKRDVRSMFCGEGGRGSCPTTVMRTITMTEELERARALLMYLTSMISSPLFSSTPARTARGMAPAKRPRPDHATADQCDLQVFLVTEQPLHVKCWLDGAKRRLETPSK